MKKQKQQMEQKERKKNNSCSDRNCPFHSRLSIRGRTFEGIVKKKFKKRIVVEYERTVYIKKYERYAKKRTKIHAHLPECLFDEVNIGDYVQVKECRPLSKMKHFVFIKKIR